MFASISTTSTVARGIYEDWLQRMKLSGTLWKLHSQWKNKQTMLTDLQICTFSQKRAGQAGCPICQRKSKRRAGERKGLYFKNKSLTFVLKRFCPSSLLTRHWQDYVSKCVVINVLYSKNCILRTPNCIIVMWLSHRWPRLGGRGGVGGFKI